ncbi:MAG: hypothetical protein AB7S77_20675 [Desulfatirhabdiaceae bacterium]
MLYIVAAEDGIHTTTANFAHIGQGADNIRFDSRVNIKTDFFPFMGIKPRFDMPQSIRPTADM